MTLFLKKRKRFKQGINQFNFQTNNFPNSYSKCTTFASLISLAEQDRRIEKNLRKTSLLGQSAVFLVFLCPPSQAKEILFCFCFFFLHPIPVPFTDFFYSWIGFWILDWTPKTFCDGFWIGFLPLFGLDPRERSRKRRKEAPEVLVARFYRRFVDDLYCSQIFAPTRCF